ncbi:hypothetical protein FA95DRAFT_1578583 [Auriscalpium vulgare]|uniref:Uncharacterized protein n=1 Tax=Auriscalpium vulgare TaxID=40419 RepID=A0ACB8R1Q7_9AGAM|nr:hypothetical protein FA95DRAFT_1578583 [Auriscalpium vulgare]
MQTWECADKQTVYTARHSSANVDQAEAQRAAQAVELRSAGPLENPCVVRHPTPARRRSGHKARIAVKKLVSQGDASLCIASRRACKLVARTLAARLRFIASAYAAPPRNTSAFRRLGAHTLSGPADEAHHRAVVLLTSCEKSAGLWQMGSCGRGAGTEQARGAREDTDKAGQHGTCYSFSAASAICSPTDDVTLATSSFFPPCSRVERLVLRWPTLSRSATVPSAADKPRISPDTRPSGHQGHIQKDVEESRLEVLCAGDGRRMTDDVVQTACTQIFLKKQPAAELLYSAVHDNSLSMRTRTPCSPLLLPLLKLNLVLPGVDRAEGRLLPQHASP